MRLLVATFLAHAIATIAACGRGPSGQQDDSLQHIRAEKMLRVGMADAVPGQYRDAKTGEWQGYNVDMSKELAKELGVELEIVEATWASLIPGLLEHRYDAIVADMYATPQRALTVAFTRPYLSLGFSIMVRRDLTAQTWEDLDRPGIKFSNLAGAAAGQLIDRWFPKATKVDLMTDNPYLPLLEVANGHVDAHLTDHVTNMIFLKSNPDAPVTILNHGEQRNVTGFAYAVRPGDWHLLNLLNTWMEYEESTGGAKRARDRWYGDMIK